MRRKVIRSDVSKLIDIIKKGIERNEIDLINKHKRIAVLKRQAFSSIN